MFIETGNFILHHKKIGGIEQTAVMNYNGSRYSGEFSAVLPVSSYSNQDTIKYWVTGTDKAGNSVSSSIFVTEVSGKTVIVDSAGPSVSIFNIFNAADSSSDLTFSRNTNADSLYGFELVISDSNPIDTVYLKFYSQNGNQDSTGFIAGSDTVYFTSISETYLITFPSEFIKDGIIYPVIYLKDYFGNLNIYSDIQLPSAIQTYPSASKTININSNSPAISNILHLNNDFADSNTIISSGDSLIFTFNNYLNSNCISSIDTAIINDNGKNLGTVASFIWNSNYDSLIITLPAGYDLISGDTFHLSESIRDVFGNFADTSIVYMITDNAGPILKNAVLINNGNSQRYSTKINSGDSLVLTFSEPVDTSFITNGIKTNIQNNFKINFGQTKSFGDTALIFWIDSSTIEIGLGYNKTIDDGDKISLSNNVTDIFGNRPDTDLNLIYCAALYDTIGLNVISAYLDTVFDSSGKTINVTFSEPIDFSTMIPANFISSKGTPDSVFLQNSYDTDKCYIILSSAITPGIDWIRLTSDVRDTAILNNVSTELSNFTITDIDSPYIVTIYFLNNDTALGNTQISAGDTIIITFSEPMNFSTLTKQIFIDSFPINGGLTGDTYGDFNYSISSDNKKIFIVLGAGSTLFHGDTINPSPLIKDVSGNPDISADTNYVRDNAGPVIIGVGHTNYDTVLNSTISAGDKINLIFSEPIYTPDLTSANSNFLVNNFAGNNFGAASSMSYTYNGNTVAINLSSNFTIKYSDAISFYPSIRDIHGNYADSFYSIILTDSIPPYLIETIFQNCDTSYTSFSTGDTLILKFSENIDTNTYNISNLTFSNPTNTFGTGASSHIFDSSTIKIILGTNPVLHHNDTLTISGIKDFNNNFNIAPLEVYIKDTVPPTIIQVVFTDADNNSEFSPFDTFTILFSEPMDTMTLNNSTYFDFSDTAQIAGITRNLGANVNTLWLDNRYLNISLGTGFTARHNDEIQLLNVIKDANGYGLSYQMSGILKDTAGPQCVLSYLDTNEDSYSKTMKIIFNVPIDTSNISNPAYYYVTDNSAYSASAVDSRTLRIKTSNPINASIQFLILTQDILDKNGAPNATLTAQNIIDTTPPEILYSIINPVSSGDTLNKTIDVYFNESINSAEALNPANYSNPNISNIILKDSTSIRITLNTQFKALEDSFYISNVTDYADSNIIANTYSIPSDSVKPFLDRISSINNDSNAAFTFGDTIILYFSESINTAVITPANVNSIFNVNFGDISNIVLEWDYYNTILKIQLGSFPSIIYPSYINPSNVLTDYAGNSDSSTDKLIPDNYDPDAPSNVYITDTEIPAAYPGFDNDGSIYIYWTLPVASDVDSYAVYISINSGADSLAGYTTNNYFNYSKLTYHNSYKAKIKSIDKSGRLSVFSVQSSAIISDTYSPVADAPLHSDSVYNINFDTDLFINWSWSASDTDILFYRIYVDSGAGYLLYDTTINIFYILTAANGCSYSLKIDAIDWAGNTSPISAPSIYVTVDTGAVSNPNKPIHSDDAVSGFDNDTSLYFLWSANEDADFGFYKIFYNFNFGQYIYCCSTALNYYNLNVNVAGTYTIKIFCYDSAGNRSIDSAVSDFVIIDTGVSPVNLVSPLKANTNILNETFIWSYSSDADSYIFQLSSDTFSSFKYSEEIGAGTVFINLTLDSGLYQWRIISKDNAGNTALCIPNQDFICIDTYVNPPSLVYPLNDYDTINHQPSFQWTVTDADSYIWYFGTDTGYGFKTVDSGVYDKARNYDTLFGKVVSDTYFWYVYVSDNAGNTNISQVNKIIIRGVDYFNSISPVSGTDTNILRPLFIWEKSISAVSYYVVYSLTSNFSQKYFSQTTANTYIVLNSDLPNPTFTGDTIYWYVIGTDPTGDTTATDTKYYIIDSAADSTSLISPVNLKESKDTFISFVWTPTIDAVSFQLQLDSDTIFDIVLDNINIPDSSTRYDSVLEIQGTYFWRIKAIDRFGNYAYSNFNKLVIDYTVGKSVCAEPINNSYFHDRTPIFKWSQVSDADSYLMQLSGDSSFSATIFSQYFYDTVFTYITQLADSVYYWRIVSFDTAGNKNYSDILKFTIDNVAPKFIISIDSNLIQSGQNYYGYIEEKNIDSGYMLINNETFYFTLGIISDTLVLFNANISVRPGISSVKLFATDKSGLSDSCQFVIFVAENFVEYEPDTVYTISDTGSLVIQFNNGNLTPSFGVSVSNYAENNFDTVYLKMNFKNTVQMPVRLVFNSLSDSNLAIDTTYAKRFSESQNSAIELILYDSSYNRIDSNEQIFNNAYIEFEIDKNLINSLGTRAFGIFTAAAINNKWYEINNEYMPNGKVIKENYIYTDTSIAANIKHFSIYTVVNKSISAAMDIDNVAVFPNPYIPNKNIGGGSLAKAAGGIHFGIDSNNDGTIDNGLPLNSEITIYTLLGEKVSSGKVLANGVTVWDAKDKHGASCASGLYLAVIKFGKKTLVKKIAVVR